MHTRLVMAFVVLLVLLLATVFVAAAMQLDTSTIFVPITQRSGPAVYGIDDVFISPDALFVNESGTVTVLAAIRYDSAAGTFPTVKLNQVNAGGQVLATIGILTDDGDLANGDEIAGDGIFSFSDPLLSSIEGRINLRVDIVNPTFSSEVFSLDYITHISEAQFNEILAMQTAAVQDYENLVGSLGEDGARDAVLADIQADPDVIQAGLSDSSAGIWILHETGILGGLMLNPDDTRSGAATSGLDGILQATGGRGEPPNVPAAASSTAAPAPAASLTADFSRRLNAALDEESQIQNNKAIVLGAFNWQFGTTDDAPGINNILSNAACPSFDVTYLLDGAVTVDVIKTLDEYGIVALTSHGDTFYNGILSLWSDRWGWNGPFGQVVFLVGEQANAANRVANEVDLRQGRLAITSAATGSYYSILPSFIGYYSGGGYPNSLVYIGACRSTFNNTMGDAFTAAGAKTFIGYSEYVNSAFAGIVGVDFFDRYINQPGIDTTGEAFIPGQFDTSTPPAYFELIGDTDTELADPDLLDGDFESGTTVAWSVAGDGRVITQLGGFSPTSGAFMGIISTGLGFTASSGEISQQICLPGDAETLDFSWNFSSEEFVEWCGSQYQDFFSVTIYTDSGPQNLFYRNVDSLCGSVFATALAFDQSGAGCEPNDNNDCTVWSTGWLSASLDVSAIAAANEGKAVELVFSAGDVGDSVFDSAILLDNIEVITP